MNKMDAMDTRFTALVWLVPLDRHECVQEELLGSSVERSGCGIWT